MSKYDKVMKNAYKFYDNARSEETYELDYSIIRFLLPRIKKFVLESDRVIDWDFHKEHDNIDIMKSCKDIIDNFEFYLDNRDSDDINTCKAAYDKASQGFYILGDIIEHLSW